MPLLRFLNQQERLSSSSRDKITSLADNMIQLVGVLFRWMGVIVIFLFVMVHPSRLLRTHSDEGASQFSAPLDAFDANTIDCGIKTLPCLNALNLERFATPRWFLVVLSLVGLMQGAVLSYFRGTAKIWMQHYSFSSEAVECLIYMNEVFSGIFALFVAHYGNKIHRASWLGGLVIYQSIASLVLLIPEIYRPNSNEIIISSNDTNLCKPSVVTMNLINQRTSDIATLVLFFFYQLFFSFATISFVCHGVTYLDDSVKSADSASYIAGALASKELGKHFGMYLAWVPHYNQTLVFRSPVWLMLGVLTFIIGTFAAMFPRHLPSAILKESVASILDIAQGIEREEEADEEKRDDFCTSFYNLIKNKILLLNIFASVFMTASLVNFQIFQKYFFQSRFLVSVSEDESGFSDTYLAQIIVNLLKQPFIVTSMIASGVLISKLKPNARSLITWNLSILVLVIVLFIPHAFFTCSESIQSEYNRYLTYYCNSDCDCNSGVTFSPVCTEIGQKTYFSPCHAGCTTVQVLNNVKIYGNCSCGDVLNVKVNGRATEGSCDNCDLFWALAQVSLIISAGLIASTIVPNILINLRCIANTDKALALALWITFIGTLPFIPFKLIYGVVADAFCRYQDTSGKCLLHSHHFGTFLSVASIALMAIAALLTMLVMIYVKDLDVYNEDEGEDDEDDPVELEQIDNQQQEQESRRDQVLQSDV